MRTNFCIKNMGKAELFILLYFSLISQNEKRQMGRTLHYVLHVLQI